MENETNPMLQFSKHLVQNGVKVTLVNTISIWNKIDNNIDLNSIESISDVSKKIGIPVAVFIAQACCVNTKNFHAFMKWIELPISSSEILLLSYSYKPVFKD